MRHAIRFVLFLGLGTLLIAGTALADSTTFKVNMKVMQQLGLFDPATQAVAVRGSFNDWGGSDSLTDADADLIYEGKVNVGAGASIAYKYVVSAGTTVTWEDNIGNRELALTGSNQVLDPVEWNNGIRFRVAMSVQESLGNFNPTTQFVSVMGSFNGWAAGDSLNARKYQLTYNAGANLHQANLAIGSITDVQYKFTIHNNSDGKVATWENDPNRTIVTTGMTLGAPSLPEDFFSRDTGGLIATGTLLFQVDITPLSELGLFNASEGDTLELRGDFNDWNDNNPDISIMRESFLDPNIYELPITLTKVIGSTVPYKFFIKFNSNRALWGGTTPVSGWEEPGSTGGGNRNATFSGEAQQTLDVQTFNDIFNVLPQGQTTTMNFVADMRCFLRNPPYPEVNKAQDTLRMDVQDEIWHFFNGTRQYIGSSNLIGKGPTPFDFSDADGDSIYRLLLTVNGPIQNWVQYHLNWQGYDDRNPGIALGRRRVRYVRPDTQGNYASDYTMGLDYIHTESTPLVVEDPDGGPVNDVAPCSVTPVSVEQTDPNAPETYALGNNYPNPFNPSTTFEYSLRKNERVTITLYNALGQKIADLVNEDQAAGKYKVTVDLSELSRSSLATGVYFYKMKAGDFTATRRMMFLK